MFQTLLCVSLDPHKKHLCSMDITNASSNDEAAEAREDPSHTGRVEELNLVLYAPKLSSCTVPSSLESKSPSSIPGRTL